MPLPHGIVSAWVLKPRPSCLAARPEQHQEGAGGKDGFLAVGLMPSITIYNNNIHI